MDDQKIKKEVEKFYDSVAKGKEQLKTSREALNRSLGYKEEDLALIPDEANLGLGCGNPQEEAEPKIGENVLDLGCGKGMDVFLAAKKVGPKGFVLGVDGNEEMITTAKKIAKKRKFHQVEFRQGAIEDLPVEDSSFDIVLSNCVINLSTEKEKVYGEIYRVLKPRGRIGISDIVLKKELPKAWREDPKMYGT